MAATSMHLLALEIPCVLIFRSPMNWVSVPNTGSTVDDHPAKNQKNYYQLELGENGPSPILSVEYIELGLNNVKIFPNPISTRFSLAIQNRVSDEILVEVFDMSGHLIYRQVFRSSLITTDVSKWQGGIHIIQITNLKTQETRIQKISILGG